MKYPYIFGLMFLGITIKAQVPITSSQFPSSGDEYLHSTKDFNAIDYNSTGTNFSWDFTDLTFSNQNTIKHISVFNTNPIYIPFFSNPLESNYMATSAVDVGGGFNLMGINIDQVVNFYKKESSKYSLVGLGMRINGIPIPVKYDNIDHLYQLPLNYGDGVASDFSYLASVPSLGAYGQSGDRVYVVDGWGELNLPNYYYSNVLRVKTSLWLTDTIYIDSLSFGINLPRPQQNIYEYFAENEGEPVLTIQTNIVPGAETVASYSYKDLKGFPLAINEASSNLTSFRVFGISDGIKIEASSNISTIQIYSQNGQLLEEYKTTSQRKTIFLRHSGIYFVRIKTTEGWQRVKKVVFVN